jgi:hypothetical protein
MREGVRVEVVSEVGWVRPAAAGPSPAGTRPSPAGASTTVVSINLWSRRAVTGLSLAGPAGGECYYDVCRQNRSDHDEKKVHFLFPPLVVSCFYPR